MNNNIDILIQSLEDNGDEIDITRKFLIRHGIDCDFFDNREDFFAAFNKNVHMAIIDLNLGKGIQEGIEILQIIKRINKYCYTIAMSAFVLADPVIELRDSGTDRFVNKNKPGYLDNLLNIILEEAPKLKKKFSLLNEFKTA